MSASENTPRRPLYAARYTALFVVGEVAVLAGTGTLLGVALGGPLRVLGTPYSSTELLVGTLLSAITLFLLMTVRPPTDRWGYGWRGVAGGYTLVIAAPMTRLVTEEWMSSQPGRAGGFGLVILAVIVFTLLGGPVWLALFAVLLGQASRPGTVQASGQPTRADVSLSRRRATGWALQLGGIVASLGILCVSYAAAAHGGLDHNCYVEGPHSALAEVSERSDVVTGSFSVLPLGRSCEWARADGSGTVTATSGNWAATGLIAGCVVFAIAGARMLRAAKLDPAGTKPESTLSL